MDNEEDPKEMYHYPSRITKKLYDWLIKFYSSFHEDTIMDLNSKANKKSTFFLKAAEVISFHILSLKANYK